MQLRYVPDDKQTDTTAEIIAAFAKWIRFDWETPDMQSQLRLPKLVSLIGHTTDKRYEMPWRSEKWVANYKTH